MPFSPVPRALPSPAAERSAALAPLAGLLLAAGLLLVVTLTKLAAFDHIGPDTPFLLYFVPVIAAAWFGGWRGGLIMTVLSGVLGIYFFLPLQGFSVPGLAATLPLGAFLFEGGVITFLTTGLRKEHLRVNAAAQEAEASVAKLEGVLRGVAEGITLQTPAGRLIYANDAAARLTGFGSAAEMLAAPVSEIMARFELLDPDGRPFDLSKLPGRRVLQGLPAPEQLVRFRVRSTGEERFSLIRANAVRIDGDDGLVAVNVFQDVTERRRQQEALRDSEEWFSTTLQSIGDAVIATDEHGSVTFMNPLGEKLTGWSSSAARGKSLSEVFRIVNEETRAPAESPVLRVLREGKVVGLANHTLLLARGGAVIAIDDSAAPIRTASGRLAGTVLVFRDVSEQRAEERRRAFVARATAELAASLDYRQTLATVVRLAVPSIGDWCAIDMYEEGRLRRLAVQHVDPKKVQLVYDIERLYPADPDTEGGSYQVARTGESVFIPSIPEALLAAAAKDERHLELIRRLELRSFIAVPLTASGKLIGVLSMAMAESGRQYRQEDLDLALMLADRAALAVNHSQLFEQATLARADAEAANRAKDDFLAMLGHELRNPLSPMLTALELMKLQAPTTLEHERAILERQVKHLAALVDDLLDVSRIVRGKIKLARTTVDLSDTLAKALELSGSLVEKRGHQLITEVPRSLCVHGDPVRLAQVLSNLVANAAKYTPPGGRIEIGAAREDNELVLRVRDSGVGLPPELMQRVFEPFVQGAQSLERGEGGLGLGLAIVKSVVELHGGRVFVKSEGPGKGSEFGVVLPALDAASPVPNEAPASRATARPTCARVLVVDDNEDALELLAHALSLAGYDAHTACDAATAISRAQALKPDVALLDIGLPVMDGYTLARRLRDCEGLERLRLVAITGYGQAADKQRAQDAGFDEHLVKPISLDEVQRVLGRLLGDAAEAAC